MKKLLPLAIITASAMLLTGCLSLQLGGGESHEVKSPTLGQQLVDLQKAKDSGAITDAEFQTQKAKLLGK
jgi:PBP1b-binding outer membrane lipoprotein LpoB